MSNTIIADSFKKNLEWCRMKDRYCRNQANISVTKTSNNVPNRLLYSHSVKYLSKNVISKMKIKHCFR